MIENREEYLRMYEVERNLWWYRTLHQRVLATVRRHFKDKSIKILDAACGTGGLLAVLRENGYTDLCGFDYAAFAVEFSAERGLDVSFGDLRHVEQFRPGETYDVICCNDALYFLPDDGIVAALSAFRARLRPGGILIVNIHAFRAFAGTHDLAVGSSRRFTFRDFREYAGKAGWRIVYRTYWPFLLSFPILLVRQWQQYRIRKGKIDPERVDSDVSYPGDLVNGTLRAVMGLEERLLPRRPFGSSLFLVMK